MRLRYRFKNGRWRPKPSQIKKFVRETERYVAWRNSIATDQVIEAACCRDLIERVRAGGWITPDESDMPQPDSDDSYDRFVKRSRAAINSWVSRRTTNGEGIR